MTTRRYDDFPLLCMLFFYRNNHRHIIIHIERRVNAPNAKAKMEEGEYVPDVHFYAWSSVVLPFLEEKHF